MKRTVKIVFLSLLFIIAGVWGTWYFFTANIAVLDPKGMIAAKQRSLLVNSTILMLIVIIPVYLLTFFVIWKYRAKNTKAHYTPEWDFNLVLETIWWAIPFAIIVVLSIMTWTSSHELDPFKPIETKDKKALTIQVVALQWKWLFIYPEQNIATINFLQIPENTPIAFEITADAPMNSFWIPKLGGQVYAMPGMKSKLHLIASEQGSYRGSSANISGVGFARMVFETKVTSGGAFHTWVRSVKQSRNLLNMQEYNKLVEPTETNQVRYYRLQAQDLYEAVVNKYMIPKERAHAER